MFIICNIKTAQHFRRQGTLLTVIFTRAAREPFPNNGCGPLPKRLNILVLIHSIYFHDELKVIQTPH